MPLAVLVKAGAPGWIVSEVTPALAVAVAAWEAAVGWAAVAVGRNAKNGGSHEKAYKMAERRLGFDRSCYFTRCGDNDCLFRPDAVPEDF